MKRRDSDTGAPGSGESNRLGAMLRPVAILLALFLLIEILVLAWLTLR